MSLDLEKKKDLVTKLNKQWASAQAVLVAENKGLSVADMTQLRVTGRKAGVELKVIKNTLARRAATDTPFAVMADHLQGPLLYGTGQDPVQLAKVLSDFAKSNGKLALHGGALNGRWLDSDQVTMLASLPSREVLLAQLLGILQAPIANFARTLHEIPAKFARTLAAVQQAREA